MYYFLYSISLLCLSQSSIIIKWSQTDPLILGSWRLLLAGIILFLWSQSQKPRVNVKPSDFRKIIAAGFAFFIHLFSYAYAAHHTSIAHVMLIFSLNPVTTALGSWFFFKEKITKKQLVAYILALIGIYLLAHEKQGTNELEGDVMALVAAVTFSAYALLSHWARRDLSNSIFASRLYLSGSFFFFIAGFIFGTSPIVVDGSRSLIAIILLTLFPTLLGHGIFTLCLKHIPLYVLSLGKLLEPGVAAISAYFLFSESLSFSAIVSSFIIFASVLLVVKT